MNGVRSRITYANVTATLALFLALGGGLAWAIGRNSVGPKQIRPNAVRSSEVKNGALKGVDIDEASLGTIPSAQLAAFARVSATGDLDEANSKGVSQAGVTYLPVDSTICFRGLPFQPRGGQVTTDYDDASTQTLIFGLGAQSGCAAGTQAFVYGHSGLTTFYAAFYR